MKENKIIESKTEVKFNEDKSAYISFNVNQKLFLAQVEEDGNLAFFKKYKIRQGTSYFQATMDGKEVTLSLFIYNDKNKVSLKTASDFPGNAEYFLKTQGEEILNALINSPNEKHKLRFHKAQEQDLFSNFDYTPVSLMTENYFKFQLNEQAVKIETFRAHLDKIQTRSTKTLEIIENGLEPKKQKPKM